MGELGINIPWLVAQVVNFGILFVALYFVAYKKLMKTFDARQQKIKESMEQTEYVKEQAARAEEDVRKQIETARREAQEIVNKALRTGDELRQKAQQDARADGEALIVRARSEIEREKDQAIDDLRREFGDLAISAAEKVISQSLDTPAHRKLIDRVLEESVKKTG